MKKPLKCLLIILAVTSFNAIKAQPATVTISTGTSERAYLVNTLTHIADPVLNALSKNELRKLMPVEAKNPADRKLCTHLEAFGRLLAGMAPWLELGPDNTPEGKLREKYINLALTGIRNATDPKAPDFLNFCDGQQPVVDAAFFAQALLRSPNQLWGRLDAATKGNVIAALKSSRVITPPYSNWLLFSATIEAALLKYDHSGDKMRIDYAVKEHLNNWYKGDGAYGDGPNFHWDYYNSFVIQPMLVEVLKTLNEIADNDKPAKNNKESALKKTYNTALAHITRYAAVQERLISPEGTYPPIGRSLAYRCGAFQALSMVSLMHALPETIKPQQVRAALYTLIKRQMEAPQTFDKNGWLQTGIYGHQPGVAEIYISTGSLYLCSEGFLTLGLPATDEFWKGQDEDWTAKKVWKGIDIPIDHAVD